jgi:dihydroxyacetone kinase-like predicted kinase
MRREFDKKCLREVVNGLARKLDRYRVDLNRLNVFPIADGDTGDNLVALMRSVVEQMSDADDVVDAVKKGALLGARGSSGVIFGQALHGFVTSLPDPCGADGLARALTAAADAARLAITDPVEGTILTIAGDAARAARSVSATSSTAEVVRVAAEEGHRSLARTPELLPPLAEAGVVDSGGAGYVLFLDTLRDVILGEASGPLELPHPASPACNGNGNGGGRYEVVCLVGGGKRQLDELRHRWRSLGDTVAIGGGEKTWRCHVHTDDVAAVLAAARTVGDVSSVEITDLMRQASGQ